MPNHKSAIKRHRQSLKRRANNRMAKSAMRTNIAKLRSAVTAGDLTSAKELLKGAEAELSRAGAKGKIHRKNASRSISRLTKLVAKGAKAK